MIFLNRQDLLQYDLLFSVGLKSISQFSENKTDLLIIPTFLNSVNGKISKFQKKICTIFYCFCVFLWVILGFWPDGSFLMKLIKHFSK